MGVHQLLLVREVFSRVRDVFGLSRTYKGVPSSIPDRQIMNPLSHPTPHREPKTIEEIIGPYQNLTSFLFDHHFWTFGQQNRGAIGTPSRSPSPERTSTQLTWRVSISIRSSRNSGVIPRPPDDGNRHAAGGSLTWSSGSRWASRRRQKSAVPK